MARKRLIQFVELIATLGPNNISDVPARFRPIGAFIFAGLFGHWAADKKKKVLADVTGYVHQLQGWRV